MITAIKRWLEEVKMESTHLRLTIGEHEIWVDKNYRDSIQERLDAIFTIAKMMNYRVEVIPPEYVRGEKKNKYVVEFHSPQPGILADFGIYLGVANNVSTYFSTFEKDNSTTERTRKHRGYYAVHYYGLKYKAFIKNLEEMPKLF